MIVVNEVIIKYLLFKKKVMNTESKKIMHLDFSLIAGMRGFISKDELKPMQSVFMNEREFVVKEVHTLNFKYFPNTNTLRIEAGFDFISTKIQVERFLRLVGISSQKEFMRLYFYKFSHSPGVASVQLFLNSFVPFRNFFIE